MYLGSQFAESILKISEGRLQKQKRIAKCSGYSGFGNPTFPLIIVNQNSELWRLDVG